MKEYWPAPKTDAETIRRYGELLDGEALVREGQRHSLDVGRVDGAVEADHRARLARHRLPAPEELLHVAPGGGVALARLG